MNRLFLAFFFLILCGFSQTIFASDYKNYVSLKYGVVKSNYLMTNYSKFKEDHGTAKDIEFFWGNFGFAKLLGGIRVSPQNKINGYLVGFVLQNKDIISVRSYSTEDELLKANSSSDFKLSFGNIKAHTTEYSYIRNFGNDTFIGLTYGTSNYPASISTSTGHYSNDPDTFVDPKPSFHYLFLGVEIDPIRAALLNNSSVSEQFLAGDLFYGQARFGLGFIKSKLSDTQYSFLSYSNINHGLKNESGYDIYTPMYYELGAHYSVVTGMGKAVAVAGAFAQSPFGIVSALYKMHKTSAGYYWAAEAPFQYGFLARLAIAF